MSGLDGKGSQFPNGLNIPADKVFIGSVQKTLVTTTDTQTLTNKTLTSPNINEAVAITATATELNKLAGVTAGTATASKAAVLGANKNLDVLAVADLKLGAGAGTSIVPTAAQINLLAQGVAAGYKIARGTLTPATASDTVVTGLATVVAAVASLKGAPSLTHMFVAADIGDQAVAPAAGSILIKTYKPTGAADVTPIAATTPWSAVDWIAIGT
ncbi:MAG: hypothetical protein ACYC4H_00810 [Desulfocucumaceae bacterium]